MAKVRLPYPHEGQRTVRREARRFNWLAAGRRWRKTTMVMCIAVESALQGKRIIWGAPVFDQVRVGWEETQRAAGGVAHFNSSRMVATFPNGGAITYRSLDNPDNARGHTADGVVIDECADVVSTAWYEVLRPMLIDTNGWAWGIGSPKGRNWFWNEHMKAQLEPSLDAMAWRAPTLGCRITDEGLVRVPHPLENASIPFSEIMSVYQTMPERSFRQEVLSEFIEDSGGVFRGVRRLATATPQHHAIDGHAYVIGVDWGRTNDATVFSVLDATLMEQCAVDRMTQTDYTLQVRRLRALWERFGECLIVAEQNSMGGPLIEQMAREGMRIRAFQTTNATKQVAIDGLALAFEREALRILPDEAQIGELEAYESETLPSGMIRYSAPDGLHDDFVMALAMAYSRIGRTSSAVGAFL